jgi:AmmeMemoRadiSam system protein B/AmmeMemoRadiSam system protein A
MMKNQKYGIMVCMLLIFFPFSCKLQTNQNVAAGSQKLKNRNAIAAGSYYPANQAQLISLLDQCMAQAASRKVSGDVLAVIVPHAGYVFSGSVAASSFNQIPKDMKFDNIFIVGSSHHTLFDGASIYNQGHYITPLGTVPVNLELANDLINAHDCFDFFPEAHSKEHSIEVQLPFLQHHFTQDFKIVPIVIGTQDIQRCRDIAEALLPYFNPNNLFVISTDFSHYPAYEDAVKVDKKTASAVVANAPEELIRTLQANAREGIPGLLTSMCGWSSVLSLLYMTEHRKDIHVLQVDYKNSGDTEYGDRSRVVGYHSICFTRDTETSSAYYLDKKDKDELLKIARKTIEEYLLHQRIPEFNTADYSKNLLSPAGAFVTLQKNDVLRGCIGQFEPDKPLYEVVRDMSISSSTRDYRFPPVTPDELPDIHIEISVLSPVRKIESVDEIVLGKHGIYIVQGSRSGTFLPQVATQTGWNLEEFLGYCAKDKAGIGWDGWKDADIYVYEAFVFEEK